MEPVYKFLLFFALGGAFLVTSFYSYRFFNRRIKASKTGGHFLVYAMLLLLTNVALLLGGFFAVLWLYHWFAQ